MNPHTSQYFHELPRRIRERLKQDVVLVAEHGKDPSLWSEEVLMVEAAKISELPYSDITLSMIDIEGYRHVGHQLCEELQALPLFYQDTLMVFACVHPWADEIIHKLRQLLYVEIIAFATGKSSIEQLLPQIKQLELQTPKPVETLEPITHMTRTGWDSPFKEGTVTESDLAKSIIRKAYQMGASDIHLEPEAERLNVRFRIHGELVVMPPIDGRFKREVLDSFKVQNNMRIMDQRALQDGRMSLRISNMRELDLRTVALPTQFGETIILRLLDSKAMKDTTLPFEGKDKELMEFALTRETGLILVTGPTGSGKTTTLYKCLLSLDSSITKVITVEDPIEYTLPHIIQIGIDETSGVTFNNTLRHVLRADPDTILVGEVRDAETADLCIRATLTGHLVLSTLHTMSAITSLLRLKDLKITPQLIQSALTVVLAQRLMGKLCPVCKEPTYVDPLVKRHMETHHITVPDTIYARKGCPECMQTGIVGRLPIFEFMHVNSEVSDAIGREAPESEIRHLCNQAGNFPLIRHALERVADGFCDYNESRQFETNLLR